MLKSVFRFFLEIFNISALLKNLNQRRELIWTLTWRDFRARFRGSFGGVFWAILQPLFMMTVYTIVFSSFLQVRFGDSDSPFTFAVFLLCGLLPWNAFSESFSGASNLIRSNPNLVKRVVFPLEVLPLNMVLTGIIQQLVGFLLLLPLAWLVTRALHWTLIYLPMILFIQFLFVTGLTWIWSSLCVYLPDLRQITSLLISILMFLMPLFYPRDRIPAWAAPITDLNPMAQVIEMYRKAFITGLAIPGRDIALAGGIALAVFLVGYFWFMHTKKGFADVL